MTIDHQSPDGHALDVVDRLRHELKSPLTAISGRAQLLVRMVRRSSGLTELERGSMLDGLATIEEAIQQLVVVVDGPAPEDVHRDGHASTG